MNYQLNRLRLIFLAFLLVAWWQTEACTAVVLSQRASKNGQVLLWKNRESKSHYTYVRYGNEGRYAYLAIVPEGRLLAVHAGINEKGFGMVSTATRNLPIASEKTEGDLTGWMMRVEGLRTCTTVDEFEVLLKGFKRGARFRSNLLVGDAYGGSAVFEIWSDGYRRYDAATQQEGYLLRTNFSFAGDVQKRGAAERRYRSMEEQMQGERRFSAEELLAFSRSYYSAHHQADLLTLSERYNDRSAYCVPRFTTEGAFVIVCDAHSPRMDVVIGHPAVCFAIPVWVAGGDQLPVALRCGGMYHLGAMYRKAAYTEQKTEKRRAVYLDKELTSKLVAITAQSSQQTPAQMPKSLISFYAEVDRRFEQHRRLVEAVLAPVLARKGARIQ